MKHPCFLVATLAVSLALPTFAQTSIPAPAGWKTQTRDNGATTFTPPDLKAGEIYSVTVYDVAALGGKSLEAYLRAFAGPVGAKAGQLSAPLKMLPGSADVVSGYGFYRGPNGTQLDATFFGKVAGEGKIAVARTLFSGTGELISRYQDAAQPILNDLGAGGGEPAGESPELLVPEAIFDSMKRGGAIVPGVYRGKQKLSENFTWEFTLDLYPNGEYRVTHTEAGKLLDQYKVGEGAYKYDAKSGKIDINWDFGMSNYISPYSYDGTSKNRYCFFGRDAAGKPYIYAEKGDTVTTLRFIGPPTQRLAPGVIAAREAAKEARKTAIQAELDRIQTVVTPGRGVPDAQVAAIVHFYDVVQSTSNSPDLISTSPGTTNFATGEFTPGMTFYTPGVPISRTDIIDDATLLLRDGTAYRELRVAPDQFDVAASRRKNPENWGLWTQKGGVIQVSFGGKPYQALPGQKVSPGAPGTRLNGRYRASSPDVSNAISFTAAGRFKRQPLDPKDDPRAPFLLFKATKTVAGGDLAGTYSVNGYALTLRYDNGAVERMPFFFDDQTRQTLWFEGHQMALDKAK